MLHGLPRAGSASGNASAECLHGAFGLPWLCRREHDRLSGAGAYKNIFWPAMATERGNRQRVPGYLFEAAVRSIDAGAGMGKHRSFD
jgi:hypothetical protein